MKFILSAPRLLNFTALVSTTLLIIKILYLNNIPEFFNGAEDLGVIFEAILTSIIASYFFYIIVVHLKEFNDKRIIYPLILTWSRIMVGTCTSQLNEISKKTEFSLNLDGITEEVVKSAFRKINPYDIAPLMVDSVKATWIQFLFYNKKRTNNYSSKVLTQMIYIESEFISKIVEIDNCPYFGLIESVSNSGHMNNTDISFMASSFYKYCLLCQELKVLTDNATVKYG